MGYVDYTDREEDAEIPDRGAARRCAYSPSPVEIDCTPYTSPSTSPKYTSPAYSFITLPAGKTTVPPSITSSIQIQKPALKGQFWFEDGSAVIKIDDTFYNVHKSLLKAHSDYFQSKLADLGLRKAAPGTRRNPLVLHVSKTDFDLLLSFIYPMMCDFRLDHTTSEWLTILNISTQLKFKLIRKAAIDHLSELVTFVDRILLGREHGVTEWFPAGYRSLCLRDEPLSLEEGKNLGLEDVIKISRAREMLAKNVAWDELESSFV